ncbi:MAG TPA: hypothetical protein P5530_02565 [Candidatus Diapherotrites archaeon]|nr:hypothetical protein [Candidatus Diapherotrites archaeon]
MNLYEIKELAKKSGKAVYSTRQLSNLISKDKLSTAVYVSRLIKGKFAKKLQKGTISFTDNDFVIATQLYEPAYVSLDSALLFHNLITQVPKDIDCITTINSKYFKSHNIYYHKISPKLFFGFKKYKLDNSYAFIAEPEKATLDGLYYNKYSIADLEEWLSKLNYTRLKKYSKLYNSKIQNMIGNVRKRRTKRNS